MKRRADYHCQMKGIYHIIIKKTVTFAEKNLKNYMLKIKYLVELEIIVIIQVNTEVLQIVYVICSMAYSKKFLWCFTMNQTDIMVLS